MKYTSYSKILIKVQILFSILQIACKRFIIISAEGISTKKEREREREEKKRKVP
jgi:hypothetical protein